MPDLLRKNFLSDLKPEAAISPDEVGASFLLPNAPVALAVVANGRVRNWNDTCVALLRETIKGSDLAARRWLTAAVARLAANGCSAETVSGPYDGPSLEIRLGPLTGPDSRRLVGLQKASTADGHGADLAETVSTLSHELRTPLTSMKSSLGLVLSGEAGTVSDDQAHFLGMTMRNIDRLERLVDDLLGASRAQAGQPILHQQKVELKTVLNDALQLQEAAARTAGVDLKFTATSPDLMAYVDADKLVQVLTNVVGNALKYTPSGGRVRVWVENQPPAGPDLNWELARAYGLPHEVFNIVVADSGVGMSAEDQDRIFEPWFRGQQDREPSISGAGLGLHITRTLVEAHGGHISLGSAQGRGTTVWIRLPKDAETAELLRGVKQLRAMAKPGWRAGDDMLVAVARISRKAKGRELIERFIRRQSEAGGHGVVPLGTDVIATVTGDAGAWRDAWDDFKQGETPGENRIRWRFFAPTGPENNKESIGRDLNRILG